MYTVNIIAGASGCRENLDYYDDVFYGPWSNFRSASYGYGHFIAHNATHLQWSQLLAEGAQGTNDLWIIHSNATRGPVQVVAPPPHPECDQYCFRTCVSAVLKSLTDTESANSKCAENCGCQDMVSSGKAHEIGNDIRVERSLLHRH